MNNTNNPRKQSGRPGLLISVLLMTRAQLRYRTSSIVVAMVVEVGFVVALLVRGAGNWASATDAATWLTFFVGFLLGSFGLSVDTGERRVRMLVVLPVRRTAIALSRLLGAILLPGLVSACAWVLLALGSGGSEPLLGVTVKLATVWAWVVVAIYCTFFFEEMNIALSARRWLVYFINLVVVVGVFSFALSDLGFGRLLTPWWLGFGVSAAALLAVGNVRLFRGRDTFDVGVSPWHGLPVDWSKERGASS